MKLIFSISSSLCKRSNSVSILKRPTHFRFNWISDISLSNSKTTKILQNQSFCELKLDYFQTEKQLLKSLPKTSKRKFSSFDNNLVKAIPGEESKHGSVSFRKICLCVLCGTLLASQKFSNPFLCFLFFYY